MGKNVRKKESSSKVVSYLHHDKIMAVREDLMGKHRDYCLCHRCELFKPEEEDNHCSIAGVLYWVCVKFNLVTPVWECAEYKEKVQGSS